MVIRLLNITDIRIRLLDNDESKRKAVASITIDGCFVIHDIRVVEGTDKLFVSMPSRKAPDGKFIETVHPINTETRVDLSEKVLAAYEKAKAEAGNDVAA